MRVNVRINKNAIKQIQQKSITALEKTTDALASDLVQSETVPFYSGDMQGTVAPNLEDSARGKTKVTVDTPYVRKVYYDPDITIHKTTKKGDSRPNATQKYFDTYISGKKKNWAQETYAKILKKEMGQ